MSLVPNSKIFWPPQLDTDDSKSTTQMSLFELKTCLLLKCKPFKSNNTLPSCINQDSGLQVTETELKMA